MKFRPCIDIHNGTVKQIVGSSLRDAGDMAQENFASEHGAAYFARIYRERGLDGGHVILLNGRDSAYYEATKQQALLALTEFSGGLSVGGGLTDENIREFLDAGAYAGIFTSYVFRDGRIDMERLSGLRALVGREHIILDLSCKKRDGQYHIVTDRWQKFSDEVLNVPLLEQLSEYACEFLIHAVDVEGKQQGVDAALVRSLSAYQGCPVTIAGGVRDYEDIKIVREAGGGRIDLTIGSALDLFGGTLEIGEVVRRCAM